MPVQGLMKRLFFLLLFSATVANAATRTIASGASLLWGSASSWVEGSVPTAADDVTATVNSGTMTVTVSTGCRSIDFTNLTSSFTIQSAKTISIGDATAGAGNNALIFPASLVLKLGNASTSAFSFISTNSTVQTVNFNGVTVGNLTFNGSNAKWKLAGAINAGSTAGITLTKGTLDTSSNTITTGQFTSSGASAKVLVLGTSAITLTLAGAGVWDTSVATALTVPVNGSTVTLSGAGATMLSAPFNFNGMSVIFTGGGASGLTVHNSTLAAITVNGSSSKTDSVAFDSMTVTSQTSFNGNSPTNRLLVNSGTSGTASIITNTGASDASTNADFTDITYTVSKNLSAISGNSGNCGGNTGITFTTPATQTWTNAAGGFWSTLGNWTSRVPLCQDNVSFSFAFNSGVTVSADMPRLGNNIDWTGATHSGLATNFDLTTNPIAYGSYTLISALGTYNGSSGTLTMNPRGSSTLTTAGFDMKNLAISPIAGTMTLQDNLLIATNLSNLLNVGGNGTFNANNKSVTVGGFALGGTSTLNLGGGAWTLTNVNTVINVTGSPSLTVSGSSITISDVGSVGKVITAGGLHYGTLGIAAGGAGAVTISDSNTFDTLNLFGPKTVIFTISKTITVTTFNAVGTSGNVITIKTNGAGAAATLSVASGNVCCDWLSLKDNTASGGASFYAGANSTVVSNVSGWAFTACPLNPSGFSVNSGRVIINSGRTIVQ